MVSSGKAVVTTVLTHRGLELTCPGRSATLIPFGFIPAGCSALPSRLV